MVMFFTNYFGVMFGFMPGTNDVVFKWGYINISTQTLFTGACLEVTTVRFNSTTPPHSESTGSELSDAVSTVSIYHFLAFMKHIEGT